MTDFRDKLQQTLGSMGNPQPRAVREALADLRPSLADISPFLRDPGIQPYGGKTLFRTPDGEGFLFNWAANRDCAIHDHGSSWGWVYIVEGEVYHAVYRLTPHGIPVLHKEMTERQGRFVFIPRGLVHVMGNRSDAPAVTLNAYFPPITDMKVYDPAKCVACVLKQRCGAGAWWPTVQQMLRLISLDKDADKIRFNPDSRPHPIPPGPTWPMELPLDA